MTTKTKTETLPGHDALEAFLYSMIRDCGFGVVNMHVRQLIKPKHDGLPRYQLSCSHGAAQAEEAAATLRHAVGWDKENPTETTNP